MRGRRFARNAVAAVVASLLGTTAGCLDDTPVGTGTPSVRASLNANVVGAMAGGTVRIRVGYRNASQQIVPLPASPEQITVAAGTTVVLPLTVDISTCLADPRRSAEREPGCRLVIELTLTDAAGSVVDTQTREASGAPATPGQSVDFGTVTIGVLVSEVVVTPPSISLNVSQQQQVSATVRDAAGAPVTSLPVSWTTSDASVVELTATTGATIGVRALKLGSATISAAAGGKASSPVTVSVIPPPPLTIRQRPAAGCVIVGQTLTLEVDSPPGAVVWSSSNPSAATVGTTSGVVTGVASGQATVTATSGNRTGTAPICVTGPLAVLPQSVSLVAGRTAQLAASGTTGASVSFSSSTPAVATVDDNGLVRGVSAGQATITTTLTAGSGSETARTSVTVTAARIVITPSSGSISLNRTVRFTAVVQDADGATLPGVPITWSILDARIGALSTTTGASTDVRALAVGSTTVRATAGGVTGSAQFTATQPLPAARIEKVSGDGATCPTYSFGCTFVVRTVDVNGVPVSGASVQWSSGGCGGFPITTSDEEGLAARANVCSEAPPGTYSQSAILLSNQQQVTFSYNLRGLTLSLQYADSEMAILSVTSSTTTAGGLSADVRYRAGPASNYVGLEFTGTTTPTVLTAYIDLGSLPIGTYIFDVIVATTTPGLGPGVETFSFTLCDCSFSQSVPRLRREVRSAVPSSSTPESRRP